MREFLEDLWWIWRAYKGETKKLPPIEELENRSGALNMSSTAGIVW